MIAIDTNILVYAFDTAYPEKHAKCKELVRDIFEGRKTGVVTNQILAEFCSVVMKKIDKPLSQEKVKVILGALLASDNWKVLNYSGMTVFRAVESNQPFWDALIVETLKLHNVTHLITENVSDFRGSGLRVEHI